MMRNINIYLSLISRNVPDFASGSGKSENRIFLANLAKLQQSFGQDMAGFVGFQRSCSVRGLFSA